jgi:hypothetical protein
VVPTTPHPQHPTFDLDLDRRDAATDALGVVDLTARMRPLGGRRSARHTHTRLTAALARIHANSIAANEAAAAAASTW